MAGSPVEKNGLCGGRAGGRRGSLRAERSAYLRIKMGE